MRSDRTVCLGKPPAGQNAPLIRQELDSMKI